MEESGSNPYAAPTTGGPIGRSTLAGPILLLGTLICLSALVIQLLDLLHWVGNWVLVTGLLALGLATIAIAFGFYRNRPR